MALKIEDRITTLSLVVIGGLTLILGLFNIRHTIKATFFGDLGATALNLNTSEQEQLNSLQSKDTDADLVSDYDELYVYDTSPYLADSDSDGTDDKTEITSGTDPNCSGANCLQTRVGSNTNSGAQATDTTTSGEEQGSSNGDIPSADEIRELLLNAGVSQEILNQADDATLIDLYQQTLAETGGVGPSGTNTNIDPNYADLLNVPTITSPDDISNLSAAQIRQLLIASGVDPEMLEQVSDEDLVLIYNQALQEIETEEGSQETTDQESGE